MKRKVDEKSSKYRYLTPQEYKTNLKKLAHVAVVRSKQKIARHPTEYSSIDEALTEVSIDILENQYPDGWFELPEQGPDDTILLMPISSLQLDIIEEGKRILEKEDMDIDSSLEKNISADGLEGDPNPDELRKRIDELENRNKRLEDFVSVVSHDLRNPLNVAQGHIELAKENREGNIKHLEKIEASHRRMESLMDDLLILARQNKEMGDVDEVSLKSAVKQAWSTVDTQDADIEFEFNNAVIEADRGRLIQLFENLIANSIDHGGEDVSIRVGSFENGTYGFYFEDDGPGIPEDERDKVFEHGYSTDNNGTGFGLNIIEKISEAHGWELSLTESSSGGARFEIRFEKINEN